MTEESTVAEGSVVTTPTQLVPPGSDQGIKQDGAPIEGTPPQVQEETVTRTVSLDELSREELIEQHKHLQTGLSRFGEENKALKTQADDVQDKLSRLSQFEQLAQNPDLLRKMADVVETQPAATGMQRPAAIDYSSQISGALKAKGFEVDDDLVGWLSTALQSLNLVQQSDLHEAQATLSNLAQRQVDDEWGRLEGKYNGAAPFKAKAFELFNRAGGATDLEGALLAVARGGVQPPSNNASPPQQTPTVQIHRQAQVPRPSPHPVTPQGYVPVVPGTIQQGGGQNGAGPQDYLKDFVDSAKELKIDLPTLFGRSDWGGR